MPDIEPTPLERALEQSLEFIIMAEKLRNLAIQHHATLQELQEQSKEGTAK